MGANRTDLRKIEEIMRGKRVAIVGNSLSSLSTNYGAEIDKYDVVIRFNRGFITKPEAQGTKTSILILACELSQREIDSYHAKFVINRLPLYKNPVRYTFTNAFIKDISRGLDARCSSGMMAIEWCLRCRPRSIDLYGFDWYSTPTFYNPKDYVTQHNFDKELERVLKYENKRKLKIHSCYSRKDYKDKIITNNRIETCDDKMEIVYVFDKNYLPYFEMSVKTVLKYNPNAHITVVSPEKLNIDSKFDNVVIPIIKNNEILKHRSSKDRITDATFLKLHLPKLPYDKILYIDADVLCMKPLNELWNKDCKYICLTESHTFGEKQAREYNHQKYGLSGVMLMNLKALREDNFESKAFVPFDSSFLSLWCHEESIINYYFYKKLEFVDKKYNYCYRREYREPLKTEDIVLLHFPSREKANMQLVYKTIIK